MNQDALTLAAIRDELAGLLTGGRVQRVVRPSELSLGLEIYTGERHQLLLSAETDGGICLSEERARRGVDAASPLQLLLRKYVDGARLSSITQPALERVLRFSFVGPERSVDLICEIMGRLSNLILVSPEGVILECARRVPARVNRYRTVLPGQPYVPPPPQDKLAADELDSAALARALEAQPGPLFRRLVQAASGISPLLAREIVYRATGDQAAEWPLDDATWHRLFGVLQEMLRLPETHAWVPSMGYQVQQGEAVAVALAPYVLTHCDRWEPVPSISRAAATPLGKERPTDAYAGARAEVRALVDEQIERQRARLASLERASVSAEELAELQLQGQAILAMAWAIAPGQTELACRQGDVTGESGPEGDAELHIPLDPGLSPAENAQAVFRAYRKRQSAGEQVPERIAETERELAYLEQLRTDVDLAEDRPALEAVRLALQEAGYISEDRRRPRTERPGPLQIRTAGGALILVGRNSAQNETVTFGLASPHDLWLHVHGVPGAHVVLKQAGLAAEEDLQLAAALAAYYSAAREESQALVDVTERRHVRRIPGGRSGMVTYRNESTLSVAPRGPQAGDEEG